MSAAVATAAVAALICGAGGLLVPSLIDSLPEPEPSSPPDDDGPKEPYAAIARLPHLRTGAVLGSAVAGALIGLATGWVWPLLFLLPLVPVSVALGVIDARTRLLPSRIVLPAHAGVLVLAGVVWVFDRDTDALLRAVLAMVVARSVFWLLWRVRSSGMGFGDVRLAALLGFVLGHLGWMELLVGLYSGFLVFGLPGLVLAVVRRDRALLRKAFPFGPFMLTGALIGILAGPLLAGNLVIG